MQTTTPATSQTAVPERTAEPRRFFRLLIPAILLACYVAQCAWFVRTQSLTFDEPFHVLAGQDAWRNGSFRYWNDHPPLARLWTTLPLIGSQWEVKFAKYVPPTVSAVTPSPEALASRGRAMNVLIGVGLGVLLWGVARRMFSESAANFALALFAFSPGLIAHYSVITTDGIAVLMVFAAAIQLCRWRRSRTWGQTFLTSIVLGVLLLSKFYTPPFVIVALGFMLVSGSQLGKWRAWNWQKAAVTALLAGLVVWAGYAFHVSLLNIADGRLVATFPNRAPIVKKVRNTPDISLWVPAGEYIDGLREVRFHNRIGHQAYYFGHVTWGRIRSYYPVAIALKWPTIVLLLAGIGAFVVAHRRRFGFRFERVDVAIVLAFPVLLLLMAVNAKIHIGDRHVLPLYPVLLVGTAATWEAARRSRRAKVWMPLLVLAAGLNAADSLRYAPDYLSYFNPLVRPTDSWNLLSDSNVDWGQGLIALREYQQQHPYETIHLAYFGTVQPAVYGIRTVPLNPGDRPKGTVVVSATHLSGQYLDDPNAYRWVLDHPRKAVLNHSLHVFDVK